MRSARWYRRPSRRNDLLTFTTANRNRACLYSLCTRWQDGQTSRNPSINCKFFELEGELILDRSHIVEIDVGVFSIPIPVAVVPTAAVISNALAGDTPLDTMSSPYTAGNPDNEGVKTRNICPVPHPLAGLWLLDEDGITWKNMWDGLPCDIELGKGGYLPIPNPVHAATSCGIPCHD